MGTGEGFKKREERGEQEKNRWNWPSLHGMTVLLNKEEGFLPKSLALMTCYHSYCVATIGLPKDREMKP